MTPPTCAAAPAVRTLRPGDHFGVFCVTREDGESLHRLIREALDRGESVLLDFAGVKTITPPFLNVAVGRLYGQYPAEEVDARVRFANIGAAYEPLIQVVRDRATPFYAATPEQQEAMAAASRSAAERP